MTWNVQNNKHLSFPLACRHFRINLWSPRRALACSVCRYRHYCKIQIITKISCVNPRLHEYEYSGRDPLFLHHPLIYWSLVTLLNGSLNTNTFKYLSHYIYVFAHKTPHFFPAKSQWAVIYSALHAKDGGKVGWAQERQWSLAALVLVTGSSPTNYRYMRWCKPNSSDIAPPQP